MTQVAASSIAKLGARPAPHLWSFASGAEFPTPSYVPTRVFFGAGSLRALDIVLEKLTEDAPGHRVMLITGHRAPEKSWQDAARRSVERFSAIEVENSRSNPTFDSVDAILEQARRARATVIVGLGGGSVLDTAKIVGALLNQRSNVRAGLAERKRSVRALPVIAIPTTAGTGSEVTPFATVWDDETRTKHSVVGDDLYPVVALVDPSVMCTMPSAVTAGTGLDALAHGIESSWSVNANDESIPHGLAAVSLVLQNLEAAIRNPSNVARRTALARASLHAGLSIARAQTTISHAISYPLTARYGIHHGHACALSLGALTRFNTEISAEDCQDTRGVGHVRSVLQRILSALDSSDGDAAERRIVEFIRTVGLMRFCEMQHVDIDTVAADVMHYARFRNNPRAMSATELHALLVSLRTAV